MAARALGTARSIMRRRAVDDIIDECIELCHLQVEQLLYKHIPVCSLNGLGGGSRTGLKRKPSRPCCLRHMLQQLISILDVLPSSGSIVD